MKAEPENATAVSVSTPVVPNKIRWEAVIGACASITLFVAIIGWGLDLSFKVGAQVTELKSLAQSLATYVEATKEDRAKVWTHVDAIENKLDDHNGRISHLEGLSKKP